MASCKVNSTTIHALLIPRSGLTYTFFQSFSKEVQRSFRSRICVWLSSHFYAANPPNQSHMTSHFMTLKCLASKYDWAVVLSFHAVVLDCIESGLDNWGDNFSEIEWFNIAKSNCLQVHPATAPAIIKSSGRNNNAPLS